MVAAGAALALLLLATTPVAAQLPPLATVPLLDLVEIVVKNRQVMALSGERGGHIAEPLIGSEEVIWSGARGDIGMVVTDRRVLAITNGSFLWRSLRLKLRETISFAPALGERVGLVLTSERVIGISGTGGELAERALGASEEVVDTMLGENVAVLVTTHRLLGLSGFLPGFVEERVGLYEQFEAGRALANLATVEVGHRLLIFRAPSGLWETEYLKFERFQ
jgi:hypothetical protein